MYTHPKLLKESFPKEVEVIVQALMLSLLDDEDKRDVRPLMSLLERMPTVVSRMKRHILRRKTTILGASWDIVPIDDKDIEAAQKAKARVEDAIFDYFDPWVNAELFGQGLVELAWDPINGVGFKPQIMKEFHPSEIERNTRFLGNVAMLAEAENGRFFRVGIPEHERTNFMWHTTNEREPGGIMRSLIFYVYMLNLSQQEWLTFIEMLKGLLQSKIDPNADVEEKKASKEAMQNVRGHNAIQTSQNVDFEFHKIVDATAGVNYEMLHKVLNDDIEVAITGSSTLATDKERNAATVQERSEADIALWGRMRFSKVINSQLLKWDYFQNVSSAQGFDFQLPWRFAFKKRRGISGIEGARILDILSSYTNDIPQSEITRLTDVRLIEGTETKPIQRIPGD